MPLSHWQVGCGMPVLLPRWDRPPGVIRRNPDLRNRRTALGNNNARNPSFVIPAHRRPATLPSVVTWAWAGQTGQADGRGMCCRTILKHNQGGS